MRTIFRKVAVIPLFLMIVGAAATIYYGWVVTFDPPTYIETDPEQEDCVVRQPCLLTFNVYSRLGGDEFPVSWSLRVKDGAFPITVWDIKNQLGKVINGEGYTQFEWVFNTTGENYIDVSVRHEQHGSINYHNYQSYEIVVVEPSS